MSLNKISCWDILEIDVTRDKKTIKKAYAKLLRKNKPDEKPDEFKILYQAYEYALKYQAYEQDSPSVVFDVEEQEDVFSSNYQKKLDEFVKKVNERTYQNNYIKLFNNVSNWSFIEELEIYEDIELYEEASLYLFEAVTEFENKFPKELLNILERLHGSREKKYHTYMWVRNDATCWETRGLTKQQKYALADNDSEEKDRNLSDYLNNWSVMKKKLGR